MAVAGERRYAVTDRLRAFAALLEMLDEPCLQGRGHVWTYDGDPTRRQVVWLRLAIGWQQARNLERPVDWEPTVIVRTKRTLYAVPRGGAA